MSRKRLESKLTQLLTEGATTEKENFNQYRRVDFRLRQLKKKDPALYNSQVKKIEISLLGLKAIIEDQDYSISWRVRPEKLKN